MSELVLYSLLYIAFLVGLILAGLHIAVVMFVLGLTGGFLLLGPEIVLAFGEVVWSTLNSFVLVAIPLYILLGEILLHSGVSERMYRSLAVWLNRVPGGLLHTNIASCALFAATSGSTLATAATIGTVALPAFEARQYNERLVLGSLAAGGTLGILIPPSINLVIYGAMTDTSIGQLFIAGILPGALLTVLFMALILVVVLVAPGTGGTREAPTPLPVMLFAAAKGVPPAEMDRFTTGILGVGVVSVREIQLSGFQMPAALARYNGGLILRDANGDGRLDPKADKIIGGVIGRAPAGAGGMSIRSLRFHGAQDLSRPSAAYHSKFGDIFGGAVALLQFTAGDKPGLYRPTLALLSDPEDLGSPDGSSYIYTILVK